MSRRLAVCLGALLGVLVISTEAWCDEEVTRPNFLIINADDLSPDHFGCYGVTSLETPNIDALARTGVAFESCWATPMCAPTRALLMTGRYAHRTGVYHNQLQLGSPNELAARNLTFTRVLNDAGYATAVAGKVAGIGGNIEDSAIGVDEYCTHWAFETLPDGSRWEGPYETRGGNVRRAQPFTSRYWHPCILQNGEILATTEDSFGDEIYTEFLIDFMLAHRDEPFLAYFSMNLPHGTAAGGGTLPTTPNAGVPGKNEGGSLSECVEYIDELVGRLIAALDESGLREKTVVIFMTDNPDAGVGKTRATEVGARVPLIINAPGTVKPRGLSKALVSVADLFPTFAEYANASLPEGYEVDGKSLVPLLSGATEEHHKYLVSWIGPARMIRDERWLWEAVDVVRDDATGRFYDCGENRTGWNNRDVTDSADPEVVAAKTRIAAALDAIPGLDPNDPQVRELLDTYYASPFVHKLENGRRRNLRK